MSELQLVMKVKSLPMELTIFIVVETVKFLHKLESFSDTHKDFGFDVLVNIDKKNSDKNF